MTEIQNKSDHGADKISYDFGDFTLGGREDFDYLALKDHKGPSGVPLGGIGTGYFGFAPDGSFSRMNLNNTHEFGDVHRLDDIRGSFLAVWQGGHEDASRYWRLQLPTAGAPHLCGLPCVDHSVYRGLWPVAETRFSTDTKTVGDAYGSAEANVHVRTYSGCIPHNLKDSSLPVVWFEVTLTNPTHERKQMGVALSFEDMIGRRIRDVHPDQGLDDFENNGWSANTKINWDYIDRPPTEAVPIQMAGFTGVQQQTVAAQPI